MNRDDADLILLLAAAGPCSLDSSPGKNWVERAGHLPNYICRVAKGIMKAGHPKSAAIAIAISRMKAWAAGADDVKADTRAKAAKAVAQWEALRAKNAAKKIVKASRLDGSQYLMFTNIGSFNTDMVRQAWNSLERSVRDAKMLDLHGTTTPMTMPVDVHAFSWIRELWTDYIIVEVEGSEGVEYHKVPYTVDGGEVSFGEPVEVVQEWSEVSEDSDELDEEELRLLADILVPPTTSHLDQIRAVVSRG